MQGTTGPACALLAKGVRIATQIALVGTGDATLAMVVLVIRALAHLVTIATHAPRTTETSTFGTHWARPPTTSPLEGIVHCIKLQLRDYNHYPNSLSPMLGLHDSYIKMKVTDDVLRCLEASVSSLR